MSSKETVNPSRSQQRNLDSAMLDIWRLELFDLNRDGIRNLEPRLVDGSWLLFTFWRIDLGQIRDTMRLSTYVERFKLLVEHNPVHTILHLL